MCNSLGKHEGTDCRMLQDEAMKTGQPLSQLEAKGRLTNRALLRQASTSGGSEVEIWG